MRYLCLVSILLFAAFAPASAQGVKATRYPTMAPVTQYRIANRQDEIALARSAAPPSISAAAEVLVLGRRGYETAVKGTNGFVCFVQRSWAAGFDDPQFWNPKQRGPNCFNAAAAHSVLPPYLKLTEWVLAGASKTEMMKRTRAALASHTFTAPDAGSMTYMMSPQAYLSDADHHWLPHLMFFLPPTSAASWGANLSGSPIIAFEAGDLNPVTTFLVPVRYWSNGTPAPAHHKK